MADSPVFQELQGILLSYTTVVSISVALLSLIAVSFWTSETSDYVDFQVAIPAALEETYVGALVERTTLRVSSNST